MAGLTSRARRGRRARTVLAVAGSAAVVGLGCLAVAITPRPSALLIRRVFEAGGRALVTEMQPHVPQTPLLERLDVGVGGAVVDVFTPAKTTGVLPTVVWIHGGGWLSGSKEDVRPYLRILAGFGYTTIAMSYGIAPVSTYPAPVFGLNDALAAILEQAVRLNVDASRIVLAGDSAGAQLASQLAVLTTTPSYAAKLRIEPALEIEQLVGVILHCGVYDLRAMAELNGLIHWGFQTALWAYTATRAWADSDAAVAMSTINFVSGAFPPTFITGGNGDRLTLLQSVPMAAALRRAGVEVTDLFWRADHRPTLGHEYQFHLDLDEAQTALEKTLSFLSRVTR